MNKLKVSICMLFAFISISAYATRTCYQCSGINCQRHNYNNTQICTNELDVCATIFKGSMVQVQGCFEQISEDLRASCSAHNEPEVNGENNCHVCNEDACNDIGAMDFKCIQCDSKTNDKCSKNPEALEATRCPIARTLNSYCYAHTKDGHVERGCALTSKHVRDCSNVLDCILCLPSELSGCNRGPLSDGSDPNGNQSRASHTSIGLSLVIMQLFLLISNIFLNYD